MYKSPADYAIDLFGGVNALARAIERSPATVCLWRTRGHGLIPLKYQLLIFKKAFELGYDLTSHDLIYGRIIERDLTPDDLTLYHYEKLVREHGKNSNVQLNQ